MGKVTKNAVFIISGLLLVLAGCFATPPTPEPPMPTHTPTSTPTASPTIMPVCTPPPCTADEVYFCPESCPGGCGTVCATVTPDPNSITAVPTTWDELATWLTEAWQAQTELLETLRLLQEARAGWLQNNDDWLAADLDGDGRSEWVLLLYQPDLELAVPQNLWVINGNGLIFQYYDQPDPEADIWQILNLTGTADLTGDGRYELIINEESCGAHTCFGNYQVLAFRDGTLHNIVNNPTVNNRIEMSYPTTQIIDYTQDGLADFTVHGGQIGSAGAGIVRPYTQVWAWDGTAVTLSATILDDTPYRHHILYEANDLMAADELDSALLLYEQTINDGDLIESPFAGDDAETHAAISQFAAFRLILIDLMQGNDDNARSRQEWLNTTFPATAAADAAAILINNWNGLDSMTAACTAVESTMETYTNPTGVLLDQGYGNPSLAAADFCP